MGRLVYVREVRADRHHRTLWQTSLTLVRIARRNRDSPPPVLAAVTSAAAWAAVEEALAVASQEVLLVEVGARSMWLTFVTFVSLHPPYPVPFSHFSFPPIKLCLLT